MANAFFWIPSAKRAFKSDSDKIGVDRFGKIGADLFDV